jgi:hypothetical protein
VRRIVVRVFEGIVLAFALYAFVALPLGRKTGWGHVRAIFASAPAKEAGREVPKAIRRTLDRALATPSDARARAARESAEGRP